MTPAEQLAARSLAECKFLPGGWDKRFAHDMAVRSHYHTSDLTDLQRKHLWNLVHRYRRQIPQHIQSLSPQL
ncbi:hypothetical protein GCM10027348_32080 [Hymenobacter tenuis]